MKKIRQSTLLKHRWNLIKSGVSSIYDQEVIFSDYVLYRNNRESWGGGIFIAVHNSISSSLVSAPTDLEIVS